MTAKAVTHTRHRGTRPALFLTALLLLVGGTIAQADDDGLTPHTARYKVKLGVVSGQLNTRLERADGGFVATHSIAPTGMSSWFANGRIQESSAFESTPEALRPLNYRSDDSLSREPGEASIAFDWSAMQARSQVNELRYDLELEPLSFDRISIQYQLMHDLLNGADTTSYQLVDEDEIKVLNIRQVGTKTIKTKAGEFEVTGIQHQTTNSKRVTTLWCAADLDYLPVLIEQHRLGKLRVRATLQQYAAISD